MRRKSFMPMIAGIIITAAAVAYALYDRGYFHAEDDFISHYYRHPRPALVPAKLREYLASGRFSRNFPSRDHMFMAYCYGRLGALNPQLMVDYARLYLQGDQRQKIFMLNVFTVYRDRYIEQKIVADTKVDIDAQVARVGMLEKPPLMVTPYLASTMPQETQDIDVLWGEFCVTGDERPVLRIIDFIGQSPEVLSRKLGYWLSSRPSESDISGMRRILGKMDIQLFPDGPALEYPGDMDCRYWMTVAADKSPTPEAVKLRAALALTQEELKAINTKGLALASVGEFSRAHAKVRRILAEEIRRRKDKAAFELAVIYARDRGKEPQAYPAITLRRELTPQ